MGCKARDIPDHAAAQRHDMVAALDMMCEQPVGELFQLRPAFTRFTRRKGKSLGSNIRTGQRGLNPRPHLMGYIFIHHDQQPAAARIGRDKAGDVVQQASLDMNVIRPVGQIDGDNCH
jgi:hypothetical protein